MPAVLREIDLPDFGVPDVEPELPASVYAARLEAVRQRAAESGFDALIVYGDREHAANLAYLTAYDPRFEEALCVIAADRVPSLIVGNEGMAYAAVCPYPIEKVLYQPFSLLGQPRGDSRSLRQTLMDAGVRAGMRVGVAGWKYFTSVESDFPDHWIEIPAYIVDTLRAMQATPVNATALFMHSEKGLRAECELEQLARFEFAAAHSSQSVRDLIQGIRPGMREYEAARLMRLNGMPLSAHPLMLSGERTRLGLASPSSKIIEFGDPVFTNLALNGANTARGGFLVDEAASLPEGVRDYTERLVAPYFEAAAAWYEQVRIGITGGEIYQLVRRLLGDPFFGVTLNPGHLIHLDEWVNSPIYPDSHERLRSGMLIQVDIIPATGTAYHTTNIEDTIALADEALRDAFAAAYPEAWARIQARRSFMQSALGISLSPEILPFSNLPAVIQPFWLAPRMMMAMG